MPDGLRPRHDEESLDRPRNIHIIANLASVGVLAVSGLVANTLIGKLDGPLVLGVFTQVSSLFFVTSQLSMLGVNFSLLKHVAEFREDKGEASLIARTGLGMTLIYSLVFALVAYLLLPVVSLLLKSEEVSKAWAIAIPTLIAFNLNKSMLAILNAHERMIVFAVFMGSRFLFVLLIFWLFIAIDAPTYWVGCIIGLAESVVFLLMLPFALPHCGKLWLGISRKWAKIHFHFGLKGYLTAVTLELNSKITVLVAGVFLHDVQVGIYSMATMFLDGLMQFASSIRNNFNPVITRYFVQRDIPGLEVLIKQTKRDVLVGFSIGCAVALALFPLYVLFVLVNDDFMAGMVPLVFLTIGMLAVSARFPFTMIFIQTGKPGVQTLYNGSFTLATVVLNLALTPFFGATGAAAGTALSLVGSAWFLGILAKKELGIRI